MGKISAVAMILLMVNIVGYIVFADFVPNSQNPYITNNVMLTTLYSPVQSPDGGTVYLPGNSSAITQTIPTTLPERFIANAATFIDRIFVVFDFVRLMLAVLAFPIALVSFMGLPWQMSMLLFPPLTLLYIIGFIDLFGGGDN
jgi:hypothetical protein